MSLDVELVLQGASLLGQAVRIAVEVLRRERGPACWESARGDCPGYGWPGGWPGYGWPGGWLGDGWLGHGGCGSKRGRRSEPGCRYPVRPGDSLARDDMARHDMARHDMARGDMARGDFAGGPRHARLRYLRLLRHCRHGC